MSNKLVARWVGVIILMLFCVLLLSMHGGLLFRGVLSGSFDDPDAYYLLDILYYGHHGVPLGMVPSVLETGGAWIHWSHLYIWAVDIFARGVHGMGVSLDKSMFVALAMFSVLPWCASLVCVFLSTENRKVTLGSIWVFLALMVPNMIWVQYGSPLRGTHHMLMMWCMSMLWLGIFRGWSGYMLAFISALGMWVSPEVFPLILLALSALVVDDARLGDAMRMSGALLVLLDILVVLDPGPAKYGPWMPDHVSLAYVVLFGIICGAVYGIRRYADILLWWKRVIVLILAVAIWVLVTPGISSGVHGIIPDDLYLAWYRHISEIQPTYLWPSTLLLVQDVLSGLLATWLLYRSGSRSDFVLLLGMWVYAVLSLLHVRSVLPFTLLVGLSLIRGYQRITPRSFWIIWLPVCFGLFFAWVSLPSLYMDKGEIVNASDHRCTTDLAKNDLSALLGPGHRAFVMEPNLVPEFLWNMRGQDVRVTGGSYHRDHDALRLFYWVADDTGDFSYAHGVMDSRHLSYVVLCNYPQKTLDKVPDNEKKNLWYHLLVGTGPDWLTELPKMPGNIRVFKLTSLPPS